MLSHLVIGGHVERSIKLFGGQKRCCDGQWSLTGRYFKRYIFLHIYIYIYIYIYIHYIYINIIYILYIHTYIQSYRKILQKKHMRLTEKHPRWIANSTKAKTQFSWNRTFEWTPCTFWNPSHTLRTPSHGNTSR